MPPGARGTPAEPARPSVLRKPETSPDSRAEAAALSVVGVGLDGLAPDPVLEIPADGLRDARLEAVRRAPAQLAADLAGIDGVAPIVARPVGHELLERVVPGDGAAGEGGVIRGWHLGLQRGAEAVHHLAIGALAPAADVVPLPHAAALQHEQEPLA